MDALKKKAINRYNDILKQTKKGYKPDLYEVLNLICFINMPIKIDNYEFIKLQLLNTDDTIYLHFGK